MKKFIVFAILAIACCSLFAASTDFLSADDIEYTLFNPCKALDEFGDETDEWIFREYTRGVHGTSGIKNDVDVCVEIHENGNITFTSSRLNIGLSFGAPSANISVKIKDENGNIFNLKAVISSNMHVATVYDCDITRQLFDGTPRILKVVMESDWVALNFKINTNNLDICHFMASL